jgi:hypothetical protein
VIDRLRTDLTYAVCWWHRPSPTPMGTLTRSRAKHKEPIKAPATPEQSTVACAALLSQTTTDCYPFTLLQSCHIRKSMLQSKILRVSDTHRFAAYNPLSPALCVHWFVCFFLVQRVFICVCDVFRLDREHASARPLTPAQPAPAPAPALVLC